VFDDIPCALSEGTFSAVSNDTLSVLCSHMHLQCLVIQHMRYLIL
jgi:hypothetical protein